jgi:hypothetical protein
MLFLVGFVAGVVCAVAAFFLDLVTDREDERIETQYHSTKTAPKGGTP